MLLTSVFIPLLVFVRTGFADPFPSQFFLVSGCRAEEQQQIIDSVREAKTVYAAATAKVLELQEHWGGKDIKRWSEKFKAAVDVYTQLIEPWDDYMNLPIEPVDGEDVIRLPPGYIVSELYKLMTTVLNQMDSLRPIVEITCGHSWLTKPTLPEYQPDDIDPQAWELKRRDPRVWYDNRASVSAGISLRRRWMMLESNDGFTIKPAAKVKTKEVWDSGQPFIAPTRLWDFAKALIFSTLSRPITKVISLEHQWPTETHAGAKVWAQSLGELNTANYPSYSLSLDAIFDDSLAAFLVMEFIKLFKPDLTRERGSLFAGSYEQQRHIFDRYQTPLRSSDPTKDNIKFRDIRFKDLVTRGQDNFAPYDDNAEENITFLVLALYLDNYNWTFGRNKRIVP